MRICGERKDMKVEIMGHQEAATYSSCKHETYSLAAGSPDRTPGKDLDGVNRTVKVKYFCEETKKLF
jgi:hypothetical protein